MSLNPTIKYIFSSSNLQLDKIHYLGLKNKNQPKIYF